jgi:hypothetical protein
MHRVSGDNAQSLFTPEISLFRPIYFPECFELIPCSDAQGN